MENILLAQEIIRDINNRNQHVNVVVKLDMTKAYDRVFWIYLTKVLRKIGFSEVLIDMIWRLISNNWYSVLINDQSHLLFKSQRRLKQGDPLSQTLFIIAAEVLSRGLNNLHLTTTSREMVCQIGVRRLIIYSMLMILFSLLKR